jgi:hypothetical protein
MRVIDLKTQSDRQWRDRFTELIAEIGRENRDRLSPNYIKLDREFENYDAFHLLLHQEEIVGFAGMQTMHFPASIARVLTRLYYVPKVRKNSLQTHQLPSYASKYILPQQVAFAKELGKKAVFLSFQNLNRRTFTQELSTALNRHYGENWQVPERMYYTARPLKDGSLLMKKDVWQNIMLLKFDENFEFPLPSMSLEEWRERFL